MTLHGDHILHFLSNLIYSHNIFIAVSLTLNREPVPGARKTLDDKSLNTADEVAPMSVLWVEGKKPFTLLSLSEVLVLV